MKIKLRTKLISTTTLMWLTLVLVLAGAAKFYHYNYVANTIGQARTLRMPGFKEYLCQGVSIEIANVDHCGKRSSYLDPDGSITAYYTIYGIETVEEARPIVAFMIDARKKSKQEYIPVNVEIYSVPRSAGSSRPSKYKIYEADF